MNELQRQVYLSALGVDTYMPRWHLPFAPVSGQCQLPESSQVGLQNHDDGKAVVAMIESNSAAHYSQSQGYVQTGNIISPINNMISNIFDSKKTDKLVEQVGKREDAATVTPTDPLPVIEAFGLSVWRPVDQLLIVDARNTKLALPTDALLKNIVRHLFPAAPLNFKEEVLRCPMIENSFAKRTAEDARAELQTWLSVQCEIRPVKYLWLMGANAYLYLTSGVGEKEQNLWQPSLVAGTDIKALLLPALNELLLDPRLKKQLLQAISHYH